MAPLLAFKIYCWVRLLSLIRLLKFAGLANLCAAIVTFAGTLHVVPASAATFKSRAKQAILMDAATGAVLFQHNADQLAPPASMSKLMTMAVVFKALKEGQLKLEDEFLMSENAWRTGGAPSGTAAMFVPINTRTSLEKLLTGIAVQSGNDAAIAIAEGIAGSEDAFAQLMETEARRIGLNKSTFRNSTGLPHPEHLMTARELAVLAQYIIANYPAYYPMFAIERFKYRKHRFINRNPLVFLDIGADGLKTGYIKQSGYAIVGSAVQEGRRLIVVLNGMKTKSERKEEARKMLEWGFRSFTKFSIFEPGEIVGHARVWGGEKFYVTLSDPKGINVILQRFPEKKKLSAKVVYDGPLKPPVRQGDQVARLRVTSSTGAVNEVPLYAAEDVQPGGVMRKGLDSLIYLAFRWVTAQASGLVEGSN
jgi:serine-type D-Ala-D-Ala carboxypeptidase (penicillin-binding protein 5/6)